MKNTINWLPNPQIFPTDFRTVGLTNTLQLPGLSSYPNYNQILLNQNLQMASMGFSPLLNRISLVENYLQSLQETEALMKLSLMHNLPKGPLLQQNSVPVTSNLKPVSLNAPGLHSASKKIQKPNVEEKKENSNAKDSENVADSPQKSDKKKKIRRKAIEIVRKFKCPHEGCNKSYGAKFALKNHMRIKHQTHE